MSKIPQDSNLYDVLAKLCGDNSGLYDLITEAYTFVLICSLSKEHFLRKKKTIL